MQSDVARVGGITPYLEIAALARVWGVPLAPHFMLELSGQLLCCLPHGHILENIDGGSLSDLGALAEPIRIEDGHFTLPDAPGHGILFDRAVLAAHAVDAWAPPLADPRLFWSLPEDVAIGNPSIGSRPLRS